MQSVGSVLARPPPAPARGHLWDGCSAWGGSDELGVGGCMESIGGGFRSTLGCGGALPHTGLSPFPVG